MLTFENDELEVALITYNRSKFVKEWITRYIDEFYARNIKIVVYDSSTDELTKNEIEKVNEKYDKKIKYNYLSAELSVGHVVLHAIVNASSKYVWVAGDSRCHDLEDLDRKVFPYIKSGI
jgi:glycosyltransferase involved in cell wall biosynthesis